MNTDINLPELREAINFYKIFDSKEIEIYEQLKLEEFAFANAFYIAIQKQESEIRFDKLYSVYNQYVYSLHLLEQFYITLSGTNYYKDAEIRPQEIKESDAIEYQLQVMRNNSDYSIKQIEKYKKHMKEYKEYMTNLYNS